MRQGSGRRHWKKWQDSSISSERTSCFTGLSRRISWLYYILRPTGDRQDDAGQSHSRYDKRQIQAAECNGCGKEGYGGGCAGAKDALGMYGQKTILFVDEIHRFNKSQQDYLLPFVEDGTLLLIGATTENPYLSQRRSYFAFPDF